MLSRPDAERFAASVPTHPYFAGAWQEREHAATFDVIDPVTERRLTSVAQAGEPEVDEAITTARQALDGEWGRMDGAARGALLNRLADLLEARAEDFAILESLDIGKPGFEPRFIDLPQAIQTFRHFAGWADKIHGTSIAIERPDGTRSLSYTIREPVGVVAAITPWNSPTMIGAWKIAPALAAGCVVVLKPPEDAPLTSLLLATLFDEAGFPPGVFSVLPGRGPVTGQLLIDHRGVDKISFTGSTATGNIVATAAAQGFRRTTMELGGKNPQIIFGDADLEAAATGVAIGLFANQGEVCAAGSRVFVARQHYLEMIERLSKIADGVIVGDPFDEGTTMGSLINARQRDQVLSHIQSGVREEARLVSGGGRPERTGFFVEPTIFADVSNDMTIAREEIFGPVGAIIPFDNDEDAVRMANDNDYALAASLWTSNVDRAHSVARTIKAGAVAINAWAPLDPRLQWGGMKSSGLGRELGPAGIEANTEEKTVTVVLGEQQR